MAKIKLNPLIEEISGKAFGISFGKDRNGSQIIKKLPTRTGLLSDAQVTRNDIFKAMVQEASMYLMFITPFFSNKENKHTVSNAFVSANATYTEPTIYGLKKGLVFNEMSVNLSNHIEFTWVSDGESTDDVIFYHLEGEGQSYGLGSSNRGDGSFTTPIITTGKIVAIFKDLSGRHSFAKMIFKI